MAGALTPGGYVFQNQLIVEQQQPEWLDLKALQRHACVPERTIRDWTHRPVDPLPARVGTKILVRRSVFDRTIGHASPKESARLELLSRPQPQGSGAVKIVVMGRTDGIILDAQYLKNVTVINADVYYQGGPLRLENVVFINSRFPFRESATEQKFGAINPSSIRR
jgi:hypothetical protein